VSDRPPTVLELPFGFTWVQEEPMARASHALADGGRVWLVDPVDAPGMVQRAQGLGEVAAVVQLLDRHNRDCAAIAQRLGVAHLRLPDAVPGSPFEVVPVVGMRWWTEKALWWPAQRTLVVSEALGTTPWFTVGSDPLGVHVMLRALPPKVLRGFAPDRVLVGHGRGVEGDAARTGVRRALERARRDVPRWLAGLPKLLRAQRQTA
jgi:hypothetical protein